MKLMNFLLHREYTSNSNTSIIPKDFILKNDPSDEDILAAGILFKWQFRSEDDYEDFIYKNISEIQASNMVPHYFSNIITTLLVDLIQEEVPNLGSQMRLHMADLYLDDITAYEKSVFQNPERYFFRIGKRFISDAISILLHIIVAISLTIGFFMMILAASPKFIFTGMVILFIDIVWCAAWFYDD